MNRWLEQAGRNKKNSQWDARIHRATELASLYPFAAEGLRFYSQIATLQRNLYTEFQQEQAGSSKPAVNQLLEDALDTSELLPRFDNFLREIAQIAPEPLAQAAGRVRQDMSVAHGALEEFWQPESRLQSQAGSADRPPSATDASAAAQSLSWFFLQPYAECLAVRRGPVIVDGTPSNCPVCGAKPIVGMLRPEGDGARKSLMCMLCAHEWRFRRVYCPSCGEEREPQMAVYSAPEIPNVRVDVCDTCHSYLKTVDLTKTGLAVPIVDELAALPLDLWAREHGYQKLQINMLGI